MKEFTWSVDWRSVAACVHTLDVARVRATLHAVTAEAQRVCGVRFTESARWCEHHHVLFRWGTLPQGDRGGLILGQRAPMERASSTITFANDVRWNTGGWLARLLGRGFDLHTIALHELGHALGLGHVNEEWDSVMLPQPEDQGLVRRFSRRDAARLVAMWGPPGKS